VGIDVHKKTVSVCVKEADGRIVQECSLPARRSDLAAWARSLGRPWVGAMEATLFTGWIYDALVKHAHALKVGHSYMIRAIAASKRKNDAVDARTLADLLRCDLFPACYMPPEIIRELRRVMRYRALLVREATRMKNKTAGLLMEVGVEYSKPRLHGKRYFAGLLEELEEVPESVRDLLRISHTNAKLFESLQMRLIRQLQRHPQIQERVERLMSIDGVGIITALTWALEIGDPTRFANVKRAVSYCGLCSAQVESAGKIQRRPLSKQRNKHLQSVLIEAAKLAPRHNVQLARVYEREREHGANHNRASLAVARKLTAYLLAIDKRGGEFAYRPAA
jgi:transposase